MAAIIAAIFISLSPFFKDLVLRKLMTYALFREKMCIFVESIEVMEAIKKDVATVRAAKKKPKRKSKFTEFWEKYPHGILTIVDMKAVLK